jgi:F-type H+-transporting ATPase subunit gamma
MEELERLKRKIKNAGELQSLVKIMKTISASNIREYEQAVASLKEYNNTIEMGLQIVLRNNTKDLLTSGAFEGRKRMGAVIFGSDQGLCGNFNEQISGYAMERMKESKHKDLTVIAVGERVVAHLEKAGLPVEAHFSYYGNHLGITEVMLEMLVKIEEWRTEKGIDQIVIFYNRSVRDVAFSPYMMNLFPLDTKWLSGLAERKWPSHTLPTFSMDVDRLFSSLMRHYLFFSLYRAFVESLASENASRLLSMQMAEKNIEEHQSELNVQFHSERQAGITSELLDVMTGFEALTGM